MKKTSFIIVIIIVVVSAISIHLITSPKVLGNMSKSYSEQITTTSDIHVETDGLIRVSTNGGAWGFPCSTGYKKEQNLEGVVEAVRFTNRAFSPSPSPGGA